MTCISINSDSAQVGVAGILESDRSQAASELESIRKRLNPNQAQAAKLAGGGYQFVQAAGQTS